LFTGFGAMGDNYNLSISEQESKKLKQKYKLDESEKPQGYVS